MVLSTLYSFWYPLYCLEAWPEDNGRRIEENRENLPLVWWRFELLFLLICLPWFTFSILRWGLRACSPGFVAASVGKCGLEGGRLPSYLLTHPFCFIFTCILLIIRKPWVFFFSKSFLSSAEMIFLFSFFLFCFFWIFLFSYIIS